MATVGLRLLSVKESLGTQLSSDLGFGLLASLFPNRTRIVFQTKVSWEIVFTEPGTILLGAAV